MHCTRCQHLGAQGQHGCILLGTQSQPGSYRDQCHPAGTLHSLRAAAGFLICTDTVSSEKTCNRLVRALRSPDQMAILPISSRTQPVQHRNTKISKLKPQSLTHLHTDWQECQIAAVQVCTLNATIGTKRLSSKSRCYHSWKTHYCAQQQLENYFLSVLI